MTSRSFLRYASVLVLGLGACSLAQSSAPRTTSETQARRPAPRGPAPAVKTAAVAKKADSTVASRAAPARPPKATPPAKPKPADKYGQTAKLERKAPAPPPPAEPVAVDGDFEGRADFRYNEPTDTREDRLSTFAVDVDTAAYSIARRTLGADRMPTSSLVRVEEFLNYFKYAYGAPRADGELFTIEADGARSPVDDTKHIMRVGIQAKSLDRQTRKPVNLVFLVDTSCSMTSGDKLALAQKSLALTVDQLSERDQVAITTYAGGVRLVLPPTSGDQKEKIHAALRGLRTGGGTAMASGMTLAYQQAAKMLSDDSVTRIIVCSDGDANIGATSPHKILESIQGYVKEGVFLSTIGFGDGNYKDAMMEQLANKGNGNYFYIDSMRMAERVFARDFTKMVQDVAQDVKIQVEFDPTKVASYRLVGYENRDVADADFRNDAVDAGEIGAGHQVTALYELTLKPGADGHLATVRVRAKQPRGTKAREVALAVPMNVVDVPFTKAPDGMRFATAVMGGAELLRKSPFAEAWTYARVVSIASDTNPNWDPDRTEFISLMKKAAWLSGEQRAVGLR
ncbi:MAG: von Willebrand factor type A domain-containing protein [Deltaproteobacteria bacterium]